MSSPLLKGGVLLSRNKGAVEEAPTDGWAHARHWTGTDYEWTSAPHFEGNVGIGTTNPQVPLHVVGTGGALASPPVSNCVTIENLGANVNLQFGVDTGRYVNWQAYRSAGAIAFGVHRWEESTGDFIIRTGDGISTITDKFRVQNDGMTLFGSPSTVAAPTLITMYAASGSLNKISWHNDATNGGLGIAASKGFEIGHTTSSPYLDALIWQRENASIRFATNNTEVMRIAPTDQVGINTTAPDSYGLHIISSDSADSPTPNGSTFPLNIQKDANVVMGLFTPTGYEARIQFGQITSGSGRMARIAVPTATGDMYFETGGTTKNFHMDTAGAFGMLERSTAPAGLGTGWGEIWVDDAAPNVLYYTDDTSVDICLSGYRGTWTPAVTDSSFNLSESQTYLIQTGWYYVLGKMCYIYFDLQINSLGTMTGTDPCYIVGLPVTCTDSNVPCFMSYGGSLNKTGSSSSVTGMIQAGTYMNLWEWDSTGGTSTFTIAELSASGRLIGSALYPIIT